MKKYKMIVAYDGTEYAGWQQQKEKLAVANVLQNTFATVFNREITIFGASRTDAGVHALGQVATFQTDLSIDTNKMLQAWNNLLPQSIMIRSLEVASDTFHLHAHVIYKTYWYHFFLERPLPFVSRYGWHFRYEVDIQKLQKCLNLILGTHDFRSFSTGDDRGTDTIRTIESATVEYLHRFKAYRIEIVGPKFLKYMIRRISGACIEVASRPDLSVDEIKRVLEAKNPEHLLPNAPAKGLMLYKIKYKE